MGFWFLNSLTNYLYSIQIPTPASALWTSHMVHRMWGVRQSSPVWRPRFYRSNNFVYAGEDDNAGTAAEKRRTSAPADVDPQR